MEFVMVDCGGFKRIMSTEKPNAIRKIQDDFRNATIEGDEFGRARIYSDDEVSKMFGCDNNVEIKRDVLTANIKPTKRRV